MVVMIEILVFLCVFLGIITLAVCGIIRLVDWVSAKGKSPLPLSQEALADLRKLLRAIDKSGTCKYYLQIAEVPEQRYESMKRSLNL